MPTLDISDLWHVQVNFCEESVSFAIQAILKREVSGYFRYRWYYTGTAPVWLPKLVECLQYNAQQPRLRMSSQYCTCAPQSFPRFIQQNTASNRQVTQSHKGEMYAEVIQTPLSAQAEYLCAPRAS